MAKGFQYIYLLGEPCDAFVTWNEHLESSGLSIRNPGTKRINIWTESGDEMTESIDWIREQLAARKPVTIQWWHPDSRDAPCRILPVDGGVAIECHYGGYEDDQVDALVLVGLRYLERAVEQCVGYVFDDSE